jgi:hypothetical protein
MTETQHAPSPDANDVLMGGGGFPAVKFDVMRVWKGGRIVSKPTTRQETEFGTGKLKTFPKSGDPIMGIVVPVQTDERTDTEDDGVRRLFVEGKRLKDAVRAGVTAAGADGLNVGGQLFVAWIGEEQGQGATPAKVYEARYYPPTTPVPGASSNGTPMAAPMAEPGNTNVFGGPQTPPPAWATQPPQTAGSAVQAALVTPPAPMAEPGVHSAAPVAGDYIRSTPAVPSTAPAAAPSQDPTPEAIAALKAAGLDPRAVFPTFQG